MPIRALACVLLLIATGAQELAAQQKTVFLTDNNAAAGGANTFPWSREELRYQVIFDASKFTAPVCIVNDILGAPQRTMSPGVRTAYYPDIEIRMGATAQAVPTNNWATNNPKPTTVYRGPLRMTFESGVFRGMGLPKPFLFISTPAAPHLCVEFIMWRLDAATKLGIRAVNNPSTDPQRVTRAFYYKWTTAQATAPSVDQLGAKMGLVCSDGNVVMAGTGCNSSRSTPLQIGASGYPVANQSLDLTLGGALPSSVAMLAIGLSDQVGFGAPLPIDGGLFGAPGCLIWNENIFQVGTAANGSGDAKLTFTVPSGTGNARIYCHWWNLDQTANALGLTSSNYVKLLLPN